MQPTRKIFFYGKRSHGHLSRAITFFVFSIFTNPLTFFIRESLEDIPSINILSISSIPKRRSTWACDPAAILLNIQIISHRNIFEPSFVLYNRTYEKNFSTILFMPSLYILHRYHKYAISFHISILKSSKLIYQIYLDYFLLKI